VVGERSDDVFVGVACHSPGHGQALAEGPIIHGELNLYGWRVWIKWICGVDVFGYIAVEPCNYVWKASFE
jgi:hypothetical protein